MNAQLMIHPPTHTHVKQCFYKAIVMVAPLGAIKLSHTTACSQESCCMLQKRKEKIKQEKREQNGVSGSLVLPIYTG